MDPAQPDIPFSQTFIHPRSGKTLLHGYRVETEGVRLHLNSDRLTSFIDAEIERHRDHPDGRWHRGQMFRYLIGSQARAAGRASGSGERADVLAILEDLRFSLERLYQDRNLHIQLSGLRGCRYRGETEDLEEMLGNLIDNACKWANKVVRIQSQGLDDRLRISVEDDGPGIVPAERQRIFMPYVGGVGTYRHRCEEIAAGGMVFSVDKVSRRRVVRLRARPARTEESPGSSRPASESDA